MDALNEIGHMKQVVSHRITPLIPGLRLARPAITVKAEPCRENVDVEAWVEKLLRVIDAEEAGGVYVVDTGQNMDVASWGELMSNAVRTKGVAGVVTDGVVRDTPKILEVKQPFQVFFAARTPNDAKGRIEFVEVNGRVVCRSVEVHPATSCS